MDGVHPQHNSKPAYGWFEKGEEVLLKTNSGRQRININGALNANSLEVITVESEAVNAQSTIALFKKLEAKYPNAKRSPFSTPQCFLTLLKNLAIQLQNIVKTHLTQL